MAFVFCESVWAGPRSRWHIREVAPGLPLKFGGGIQTGSLCEYPKAGGGWDLAVSITEHHLRLNTCPKCRAAYLQRLATKQKQASAALSRAGSYPPSDPGVSGP